MALRGIRYCLIISLFVIAPILAAKNDDVEWFGSGEPSTPSTTTRGNRRTTTEAWEFIWRTRKSTLPTLSTAVDANTRRSAGKPSSSTFIPTNFTSTVITLLKNFAKFTTSDHPPLEDGAGYEYFVSVLRLEFFTMATGNHFIIAPTGDEKLEQTLRKKASGTSALWLDLYCTENIDTILNNVTRETVIEYQTAMRTQPLTTKILQEMLRTLFNKLNDAIEKDSFLDTMYMAEEIRYTIRLFRDTTSEQKVYIPLSDVTQGKVTDRLLDAWLNDLDIRKFLIHRQFLDMRSKSRLESSSENDKNGAWIRSFLDLARESCCMEKMLKIYSVALNETAKNFATTDFPRATLRVFIDNLTEAVEADSVLKSEWMEQKNDVREILRIPKSRKH